MYSKKIPAALLLSLGLLGGAPAFAASADATASLGVTINLIQIGDIHGHLEPRPNLRSDAEPGANEGGLARIAWKIKQIRAEDPQALLFNVGDTIQGSAEALYTEGQVMIDVLDRLDINGFAPGNWEFTYGARKFFDYFDNGRWGVVAANVYNSATGEHALPPYRILEVKGLRIGVMGLTTERGLPAIPGATVGYTFTDDGHEVPEIINILRNVEHVDLVIMLSEFGVAKNVALAEKYPGIDVVLSADMHEETPNLIRTSTGTLVSEVGQDGTQMARYTLTVSDGKLVDYRYEFLPINNQMPSDTEIAKLIRELRAPFVHGEAFVPHVNPMNGSVLTRPIDTVVGQTAVPLYRANFSHEQSPALVEGSSHNFITDAFRDQGLADVGIIRGFRYGTHVRAGAVRLEDLYHYIPVAPQLARGQVTGSAIRSSIENMIDGSINSDVFAWTGGWFFGFSGLTMDVNPYAAKGSRASNIMVYRRDSGQWEPLDNVATYVVSGYWYEAEPTTVAGYKNAANVEVFYGDNGEVMDATTALVNYLKTNVANPDMDRIHLTAPLPAPVYGNLEIQPLKGAPIAQ